MPRISPAVPSCASLVLALLAVLWTAGAGRAQGLFGDLELRPTLGQARGQPATADTRSAPTYTSPPGSGAGQTGFVSTNATKTAKQPPAGTRTSASNATLTRRVQQAIGQQQDQTGAIEPPRRPRREPEEDPYSQVGVGVGSFDVRPSIELRGGYDDNPFRVSNGRKPSRFAEVEGTVEAQSNWARHSLYGLLRGVYTDYLQVDGNDRPEAEALLRGRIDVTSLSRIELEGRAALTTDDPGTPDAVTSAKRPPNIYSFDGKAGFFQRFNRLELGLRGTIQRSVHQEAELIAGGTLDRSDRDYTSYGAELRAGYETMPGVEPFFVVQADRRVFDHRTDFNGIRRGSDGMQLRGGLEFARERVLNGEISAGYMWRRYEDPLLDDIADFVFDASLVWQATALTKLTLRGSSEIGETTLTGASGVLQHQAGLAIEHAFRRWLIGTAGVDYLIDDYRGAGRRDERLTFSAGFTYYFNRYAALIGKARHERQRSSDPGAGYNANIVTLGLRLQR